jgi:tripartite-type tricarboxylate transporter receptor subunit TctC
MDRRDILKAALGLAGVATSGSRTWAETFPSKDRTFRVIVPWPPGAANDALGRIVADGIQSRLGCTAIVENRAGGSGLIGTKDVIQAKADGYTLLASAFNTAVMPAVLKSANFDPEVDLAVIGRTAVAPLVCVMTGQRPQKTLAEVIEAARAEPSKWTFAVSALGSAGHLATIEFLRRTGLNLTMVPYRGTAPALQDTMAGNVQLFIDPSFALLPQTKDDKLLRALGMATASRSALAPDVPTMSEAGLPGFEFSSWYAVWAPKGTPRDAQVVLNKLIVDIMRDPATGPRMSALLIEPVAESIEDSQRFIHDEVARGAALLKSVNFEPT